MKHAHTIPSRNTSRQEGFTLIEMIVALTVLAAALGGLTAMYGFSLELADEARHKLLAAEMAEAQLVALLAAPDTFAWHIDETNETAAFAITEADKEPPFSGNILPPDVTLINRNTHAYNESLYRRLHWQAWGRLPSPDAQAYEVTVAVGWQERGRARSLALTSSVARYRAPRAPDDDEVAQ